MLSHTEAQALWDTLKGLSVSKSGTSRCYTSGRFRATHMLSDGRVVELWENNLGYRGMLQWVIVFDSYDDWMKHDHFPHNIKHEVGQDIRI